MILSLIQYFGRVAFRAFCLALLVPLVAVTAYAENSVIEVGISTPLTGEAAAYGTDVLNVLQFANDVVAQGKYKFVVEDDGCDGKRAVSVAQRFAQRGIHHVLGVVCSGALSAAAPIYDRAGILVISPSANLDGVSSAGRTAFTTMPSDKEAMGPLSKFVCERHKLVGVISEETEMAQQMSDAFLPACGRLGSKAFSEGFSTSSRDFRSQLLRLRKQNIEALFINSQTEVTFAAVLKQIRELKLPFVLYGAFFPGTDEFLKKAGPLADDIKFIDLPDLNSALNQEGKSLYSDYRQRFGSLRSIQFMFATTFESFRALHLAIQADKDPAAFLLKSEHRGVSGSYTFGPDGIVHGVPYVMRMVRAGKVQTLNENGRITQQ